MRTVDELEHMAAVGRRSAGWDPDMIYRPIGPEESGGDPDRAREDRAYAEGVEAGILWTLGRAGEPFPR